MSPQRKSSQSRWTAAAVMMAGAIAFAACDNNGTGKGSYGSMTTPTVNPLSGVVVAIVPSGFFPAQVVGVPCLTFVVPGVDLRITSSGTIDMNEVTLRLGDGSNVGGPSVTFPTASLTSRFGSTQVLAGSTRVFPFGQPFGCALLPTPLLFADLLLSDRFGNSSALSVSTTLR